MSVNTNKNTGVKTNVNQIEIIDLGEAEITRKGDKNQDWYDFQVEGKNNIEERQHTMDPNADPKKVAEALKRAKQMRIGQSVIGILLAEAA